MPLKVRNQLNFLISLAYYAAVTVLVYLVIKYALGWILPFILAFCIVSIVNPLIRFVNTRLKIKHNVASIIVMILTYAIVGTVLFRLILHAVFMLRDLFSVIPHYYRSTIGPSFQKVSEAFAGVAGEISVPGSDKFSDFNFNIGNTIETFFLSFSQMGISIVSNITSHIPTFAITFVFTIMLSFFISVQYTEVINFIKGLLPQKFKNTAGELKSVINNTVLRYLKALFKLLCITFAELSIGLLVLRTPNAIPLAAGIAIFDSLPFFGTGAILVPWTVFELVQGNYSFALGLIILYAIVLVVRNIIEPHIVGQKLGLNPIVSIVAIYLGFKLIGVLGMIFMPITIQILLELHRTGLIKIFRSDYKQDEAVVSEENEKPNETTEQ